MKTRTNQPVEGFEEDLKNELDKGSYDNAKPIYCHPINLFLTIDANNVVYLSLFVFNNDKTKLTWETFQQWITDLTTKVSSARIITTGSIVSSGIRYPANYIYSNGTTRSFVVDENIEVSITDTALASLTPSFFEDGVNKIN